MMTQKPKAKFELAQQVEHKIHYYSKGKEKIKWEKVTILERRMFEIKEGVFDWAYRISSSIFPTFESENEFRLLVHKDGMKTE